MLPPDSTPLCRYKCALTMASLFEGRHDSMIHERVASLLPMGVMKDSMQCIYEDFVRLHDNVYCDEAFMQVRCVDSQVENQLPLEGLSHVGMALVTLVCLVAVLQTFTGASTLPDLTDEYLNDKAVLETGFAIWMLFKNLMDHDPSIAAALAPGPHESSSSYTRALAFFERHTKSVEILRVRCCVLLLLLLLLLLPVCMVRVHGGGLANSLTHTTPCVCPAPA